MFPWASQVVQAYQNRPKEVENKRCSGIISEKVLISDEENIKEIQGIGRS